MATYVQDNKLWDRFYGSAAGETLNAALAAGLCMLRVHVVEGVIARQFVKK